MTSGDHQQTAARAFARRNERTSAGLLLVSKTGLLPYLDFDLDRCTADLEKISPAATVLPVSARAGDGIDTWYEWLRQRALLARGEDPPEPPDGLRPRSSVAAPWPR